MRNSYIIAKMVKLMYDGEYTRWELKEKLEIDPMTVSRYVHALHRERVIRVCEYRRGLRGQAVPAYTANPDNLPDVPKVSFKQPHAEVCRQHRAKRKAVELNHLFAGRSSASAG